MEASSTQTTTDISSLTKEGVPFPSQFQIAGYEARFLDRSFDNSSVNFSIDFPNQYRLVFSITKNSPEVSLTINPPGNRRDAPPSRSVDIGELSAIVREVASRTTVE